jgi:two-component system chemotaxis response regulator CheY
MSTMRRFVTRSLQKLGFVNIIEACDGLEAWNSLQAAEPSIQLIFSDWNMPRLSGVDFLRRVRSDERYSHLPFIMVTAEFEGPQVREALMAGASNYIGKPFSVETLQEKILQVHSRTVKKD